MALLLSKVLPLDEEKKLAAKWSVALIYAQPPCPLELEAYIGYVPLER